jgi:prefoldin subunit 5
MEGTKMSDVFDKLEKTIITDSELTMLARMVDDYQKLESTIATHEEQLKNLKKEFNQISQKDIPDFLVQFGISEIKLVDGRKVSIKSDVSVTIKDYPEFIQFLKKRHDDDIVKNAVNVEDPPAELVEQIMGLDLQTTFEQKVHPMTLKKYFRDFMEVGETPPSCVSVYTYSKTKIK